MRIDEARGPGEVLRLDIGRTQAKLQTIGLHRCNITILLNEAIGACRCRHTDKVVVVAAINIQRKVDAILQETSL